MPSRIDPFVKRLFDEEGEELRFTANEPAILVKDGKPRRLSRQPVSAQQIFVLMQEVAPPAIADQLNQDADTEFAYEAAAGLVRVQVTRGSGGLTAVISPANGTGRPSSGGGGDAARINTLLKSLVKAQGSDLHLRVGEPPFFRVHGEIVRQAGPALTAAEMEQMLIGILPPRNQRQWRESGDSDFGYQIDGVARFRVNVARDRKGPVAVLRVIPVDIITVEDLGISKEVQQLCYLTKGLVLVTGPTGSGKSTTLCALIDLINRTRTDHVITIEDPIEFVHENKKCLVTQREVGSHTESFKVALRAALREDPDVVLVGELRDLETTAIAIETAETGHLVFGTLHTTTAASTVDRMIDQFPADRQGQIRTMLSESLRGVIAQTLCRKIQGGRVAAWEILLTTPAVSNLIREGKTFQIPSIIQTNKKVGMSTLNDSLLELVEKRLVAPEEAYMRSVEKAGLASALRAKGHKIQLPTGEL